MGESFTIEIKTTAQLQAAEKTRAELERASKTTKELGKDASALEKDSQRVNAALDTEAAKTLKVAEAQRKAAAEMKQLRSTQGGGAFGEKVQEFKSAYNDAGGGVKGVAAALGVGGAGLVAVGVAATAAAAALVGAKKALHEYGESEDVVAGLDAALARQGLLVEGVRAKYQELAGQLQQTTGIADEKWTEVLTRLTAFGSTPDSIEKDAEAVKNLAGLMGGNLESAAEAVSKALAGEFQAFQRLGIQVPEHASQTEKLNFLYQQLATVGGGQLEARSKTLSGQFQLLGANIGDVFEGIGGMISRSGILQSITESLNNGFKQVAANLGGIVPKLSGIINLFNRASGPIQNSADALKSYGDRLKEDKDLADATTAAIGRQLQAMQRLAAQQDELTDAKMASDLADVDDDEAHGRKSPIEAKKARSAIRLKAADEKFSRSQDLQAKTKKALEDQIAAKNEDVGGVEAEAQEREADVASFEKTQAEREKVKNSFKYKGLTPEAIDQFITDYKSKVHLKGLGGRKFEAYRFRHLNGVQSIEELERARAAMVDQREEALTQFDAVNPPLAPEQEKTLRGKATTARQSAIDRLRQRYPETNELQSQIDALQSGMDTEREVYKFKRHAEVSSDATELHKAYQSEGRGNSPEAINAAARQVQERNSRDANAVINSIHDMGGAYSGSLNMVNAALQEEIRRAKLRESQHSAGRNQ
jgi:hypothetical protein